MPSLQYVYLNWNKLTSYPEEVPMLEWLDLSHNSIKYIDEKQKGNGESSEKLVEKGSGIIGQALVQNFSAFVR